MNADRILDSLLEKAEIPLEEKDKYEVSIYFVDSYDDNYYLVKLELREKSERETV